MISNPKCGWCDLDIIGTKGTPSYLTDVPVELMECFISYFKTGKGMCFFDEEGSQLTLVLTPYNNFIISEKDKLEIIILYFNKIRCAKELLSDIRKYKQGWIEWEPEYKQYTDKERKNRENHINELYEKLQGVLEEIDAKNTQSGVGNEKL